MSPHLAHWLEALLGMVYVLIGKGEPRSPWGWGLEGSILLGPAWEATHQWAQEGCGVSERGVRQDAPRWHAWLSEMRARAAGEPEVPTCSCEGDKGSERTTGTAGAFPGWTSMTSGHDSGSKH